jgi:hypothetical protein
LKEGFFMVGMMPGTKSARKAVNGYDVIALARAIGTLPGDAERRRDLGWHWVESTKHRA